MNSLLWFAMHTDIQRIIQNYTTFYRWCLTLDCVNGNSATKISMICPIYWNHTQKIMYKCETKWLILIDGKMERHRLTQMKSDPLKVLEILRCTIDRSSSICVPSIGRNTFSITCPESKNTFSRSQLLKNVRSTYAGNDDSKITAGFQWTQFKQYFLYSRHKITSK